MQAEGVDRYWSALDFPIRVLIDSEMDPQFAVAAQEAVSTWNKSVDRDVFVVSVHNMMDPAPSLCGWVALQHHDIHVGGRYPGWDAFHKGTPHRGSERACNGLVVLDDEVPLDWARPIFAHELGHALMLAHDGDRGSLMYPVLRGTVRSVSIQPADIRRIQSMISGFSDLNY